jgi:hypothetical protein
MENKIAYREEIVKWEIYTKDISNPFQKD